MFPEPVSPDLGTFFLLGTSKKERVIERNTTVIHLYKSNGFNMVLDVNSGSVHVVDDCVYDVLSCMNEGKNAEHRWSFPKRNGGEEFFLAQPVKEGYNKLAYEIIGQFGPLSGAH